MLTMNRFTARPSTAIGRSTTASDDSIRFERREFPPSAVYDAPQAIDQIDTATALQRFRSILVPVDGDQFGEHALPFALAVAQRRGESAVSACATAAPVCVRSASALRQHRPGLLLAAASSRLSQRSGEARQTRHVVGR